MNLRGRSRLPHLFLFTKITRSASSFNLTCCLRCFCTYFFSFRLRLGSKTPSHVLGQHCRACIKISRRRYVVISLLFPSFSLTLTSLYSASLESTRFLFFSPLPTKVFGRKRRQVSRPSIALVNPRIGLHTASTLTQELDCTRRPSQVQERTRRLRVPTITRIVKPLRPLSFFFLLPYTFVTRSIHYPVPFVSPLVFIETTRSSLSLSSFPVELFVLPHRYLASFCIGSIL